MDTNNSQIDKKENKDPNIYVTQKRLTPTDKIASVVWKVLLVIIILIVIFLCLIKFKVITLKNEIVPEAVLLNQNEIGIKKGMNYQFVYTVLPDNSTNKQVVFESSDPSIVRVNETTGYIEALKPGTATIKVKTLINEKLNECVVNVSGKSIELKSISFNEKRISLAVGYTSTLSYKISPSNATNVGLIFSSSDSSVAIVDTKGRVKAVKPGTAIITASAANGTIKDTTYVNVYKSGNSTIVNGESIKTETYPSTINVKEENLNLKIGSTNQLNATITPNGASQKITWSSSNVRVASVNQNGLVTATGAGSTTIVAKTINGKTDVCTINVGDYSVKLKKIDITTNYSVIPIGITKRLDVAFIPSNASNKTITWTSNNPSVATVDSSGNVYPHKAGEAIITAQAVDGGFKDTATLEIVEESGIVEETGISFPESIYPLSVGSTINLIPNFTPANASFKTLEFTSSNPSVATVDSNGVVKGISNGSAIITATTKRNRVSAKTSVNVSTIPVRGTVISVVSVTLPLKETFELYANTTPNNASNKNIIFTSENPKVATIDSKGIIKGVGIGKTKVIATPEGGGTSSSCVVTVKKSGNIEVQMSSVPLTCC